MKKLTIFSIISVSLFLFLIGCNAIGVAQTPLSTYQKFQSACETGDFATAESFLTESAKMTMLNSGYDVCVSFMPDGMQRWVAEGGLKPKWNAKDYSPDVSISGNTALLVWVNPITDHHREIHMTLYKSEGKWLIKETLIVD